MFTVKHIIDVPGAPQIHNLYSGDRVTFQNDRRNLGALEVRTGDTLVSALWGGRAYVMNEKGQTVSSYDLPEEEDTSVETAALGHEPLYRGSFIPDAA